MEKHYNSFLLISQQWLFHKETQVLLTLMEMYTTVTEITDLSKKIKNRMPEVNVEVLIIVLMMVMVFKTQSTKNIHKYLQR